MIKKIAKIVALSVVVLIVTAGISIAYMIRKPEPEQLCQHVFTVMEQEMSSKVASALGKEQDEVGDMTREDVEEALGMTFDQCVQKTERRYSNSNRGLIPVAQEARCQLEATTIAAMDDC